MIGGWPLSGSWRIGISRAQRLTWVLGHWVGCGRRDVASETVLPQSGCRPREQRMRAVVVPVDHKRPFCSAWEQYRRVSPDGGREEEEPAKRVCIPRRPPCLLPPTTTLLLPNANRRPLVTILHYTPSSPRGATTTPSSAPPPLRPNRILSRRHRHFLSRRARNLRPTKAVLALLSSPLSYRREDS